MSDISGSRFLQLPEIQVRDRYRNNSESARFFLHTAAAVPENSAVPAGQTAAPVPAHSGNPAALHNITLAAPAVLHNIAVAAPAPHNIAVAVPADSMLPVNISAPVNGHINTGCRLCCAVSVPACEVYRSSGRFAHYHLFPYRNSCSEPW